MLSMQNRNNKIVKSFMICHCFACINFIAALFFCSSWLIKCIRSDRQNAESVHDIAIFHLLFTPFIQCVRIMFHVNFVINHKLLQLFFLFLPFFDAGKSFGKMIMIMGYGILIWMFRKPESHFRPSNSFQLYLRRAMAASWLQKQI